jgi:hypothetical protein
VGLVADVRDLACEQMCRFGTGHAEQTNNAGGSEFGASIVFDMDST